MIDISRVPFIFTVINLKELLDFCELSKGDNCKNWSFMNLYSYVLRTVLKYQGFVFFMNFYCGFIQLISFQQATVIGNLHVSNTTTLGKHFLIS